MDNEILYDFKAALAKIIESHSDMKLVISKWREMLDSTARDVEFVFADGDRVVVPNIEKIVQTINERTLPPEPSFNKVTVATDRSRTAALRPDSVAFFTPGGLTSEYNANGGIFARIWSVPSNDESEGARTITTIPVPRYWEVLGPGQTIAYFKPEVYSDCACDFFVIIPEETKSLRLILTNYKGYQGVAYLNLGCPTGGGRAVWHVVIMIHVDSGRLECNARATLMETRDN